MVERFRDLGEIGVADLHNAQTQKFGVIGLDGRHAFLRYPLLFCREQASQARAMAELAPFAEEWLVVSIPSPGSVSRRSEC